MNSPIENNKNLAKKYGIAFIWINLVEQHLKWAILTKNKLTSNIPDIITDLFDNQTLGQKIFLAEKTFDKKILGKLHNLNNKRNILAHGVVAKLLDNEKLLNKVEQFVIIHKKTDHQLNILLDDTIKLCKSLSEDLKNIINK
jgi:hypothetical protein